VWAWLLDANRRRHQQGEPAISNYQALCRELAKTDGGRRRTHKRRVADAGRAPSRRHGAGTA
jgi:hypothetical protein